MKHVLPAIAAFALLSVPLLASAPPAPAKKAAPYSLTLSLIPNTEGWSPNDPYIALTLANSTPDELAFFWNNPHDVVFDIDYKPATSNLEKAIGWKPLKPIPGIPVPDLEGEPKRHQTQTDTFNVLCQVPPGQKLSGLSSTTGFNLSEQGFYRIKAVLTLKRVRESGTSNGFRKQPLIIQSEWLIISHTADGYAAITETHTEKTP